MRLRPQRRWRGGTFREPGRLSLATHLDTHTNKRYWWLDSHNNGSNQLDPRFFSKTRIWRRRCRLRLDLSLDQQNQGCLVHLQAASNPFRLLFEPLEMKELVG